MAITGLPTRYTAGKPGMPSQIIQGHPLANGLIASFDMREGAGLVLFDAAQHHDANITASAGFVWNIGKLRQTGNSGDGAVFAVPTMGTTSGISFSVEVLIRAEALTRGYQSLVVTSGGSAGLFVLSSGKISIYTGSDHLSTVTVATGTAWYHLVWTANAATSPMTHTLYVNGVLDNSFTANQEIIFARLMADSSGAESFQGWMDHARIWNRVLSQAEAISLYLNPFVFYGKASSRMLWDKPSTASIDSWGPITQQRAAPKHEVIAY